MFFHKVYADWEVIDAMPPCAKGMRYATNSSEQVPQEIRPFPNLAGMKNSQLNPPWKYPLGGEG